MSGKLAWLSLNTYCYRNSLSIDRFFHMGFPGGTHDNRVWKDTEIFKTPGNYLSHGEIILGDSAFSPNAFVIPCFKKMPGQPMDPVKLKFNTLIAKPRVKSEHCIGLIKGKFQYFKSMRDQIGSQQDMVHVIRLFSCAVILHNLLVADPVPQEWIEYDGEDLDENDELNQDVSQETSTTRRDQLLNYLQEEFGW